ncbi:MAG: hypothetical protein HY657_11400 [Acidobacteria bacterium]|nr:hypothetical protein [Acidobacteriota bacterium]
MLAGATALAAQTSNPRFEVGVQLTSAVSGEFDATDVGVGGRLAWHPVRPMGIEAEIDVYPRDFPRRLPFSRGRLEGLFGVTAGPTFGRVRPFARVRPGFAAFRSAPEPIACIAIFPPPLACTMAAGRTLFSLDLGGGVDVALPPRGFVRLDVGDCLLKYPGPSLDRARAPRMDGFVGHDLRVAIGGGLRF